MKLTSALVILLAAALPVARAETSAAPDEDELASKRGLCKARIESANAYMASNDWQHARLDLEEADKFKEFVPEDEREETFAQLFEAWRPVRAAVFRWYYSHAIGFFGNNDPRRAVSWTEEAIRYVAAGKDEALDGLVDLAGEALNVFQDAWDDVYYPGPNPSDDGITAERLDRAVAYIIAQDPPLMMHGSLYGDCPEYLIPGTNVAVMCVGFWVYGVGRNPYDTCRQISIRPYGTPTGWGTEVDWKPEGDVVIDGYGGVWKVAAAPEEAKRAVAFVLDSCDKPYEAHMDPEVPDTGNQFWDYLTRKVISSGRKLGFKFGTTNRCDRPWAVPAVFTAAGETYRIPGYETWNGVMMTAHALDASSNTVANLRIVRQSSEFAAGFELFHEFGLRHDFGGFVNWNRKGSVKAGYDGDFFFVEPPLDSGYQSEEKHLYAVWKNIHVELRADRDKMEIAKALILAGAAAGTKEAQQSEVVSDRPNSYDLLHDSPIRNNKEGSK